MKKLIVTLLILTIMVSVFAFDELWQKAQAVMENSKKMTPGTLAQHFESISKNAKYDFQLGYEIIVSFAPGEDGNTVTSLVSRRTFDNYNDLRNNTGIPRSDLLDMRKAVDELKASINGISNDMLNKDMDSEELEGNDLNWFGVFQETDPKKLVLSPQKKFQTMNGVTCQVYKVKYMPDGNKKNTETGTIYLNAETGVPVYSSFDLRNMKLPLELKLITDPAMNTHYTYDAERNLALPSRVEINISIPFMGNTSSMNTLITMGDYWEKLSMEN